MGAEFDKSAYESLGDYDSVVIAGEALITRALPGLLDIIGEGGNVVLEGYGLPASALFFSFGMPVKELRGYYCRYPDTVEACAAGDIANPEGGMLPFSIRPITVEKIHESQEAEAVLDSPYSATKFINRFR